MEGDAEVFEAERAHLRHFWSNRSQEEFVWALGPVERSLPGFAVRRVAPAEPNDPWVYVSLGAWQATRDSDHGMEFFLLSPREDPLHVELLAMVANLHADNRYHLKVGSTIDIGRPWIEGSTTDYLLVSLPYPYGPTLEMCYVGARHIRFLWLVPISRAEADLVRDQGLEVLEDKLDRSGVDVISPTRSSLV